jgi:S-DNA-T family DNA segregation ATPase FtsK/SpoIIIE
MARKASANSEPAHGLNDVLGLALMGFAVLLLAALLSYDRHDLPDNALPANPSIRNWVGPFGAKMAYYWLRWVGATAYEAPALLLLVGLGCFFTPFSYLRRRWLWTFALFVCCMGLLDLYKPYLRRLELNLNSPAGGVLGQFFNQSLFGYFGTVGGTIIFLMVSFISVLYLTNFKLGVWLNRLWATRSASTGNVQEEALERRARDLEKQKKQLEEQVAKSGLGADLKPVPEPTVRDLSVPQPKSGKGRKAGTGDQGKEPDPADEGEVISAREIIAATTQDILGKKDEKAGAGGDAKRAESKSGGPGTEQQATDDATAKVAADGANPDAAASASPPVSKPKLAPKKPKPLTVASTPLIGNYQLPSIEFLQHPDPTLRPTESKDELMANARLMQQTLAQFDIEVSLGDITKGPTITRYELHPAPGVKMEKITALNNNIAAALKAERIHILAPVPGKSSVGVEVPNLIKTKVILRDLLESEEWRTTKARIPLALGKDVYGNPIVADLSEMPHLLIAGSTGSGKSVCINAIISSLLYRFSPDQLRFVMIDPKVVELQQYNMLPHLVVPVVTDPKKVILALRWVVSEMEKRYQIFARVGVRNIAGFNSRPKNKPLPPKEPELPLMARKEKVEPGADGFAVEVDEEIVVPRDEDIVIPEKLSYIVVIIDELADLMLVAPADVEMAIARITQMARAAGIHCIVATQRPSVDVITGVIKANIPARIAFQVAAKVDSRTILDAMGADKLLGKGDMLYLPPGSAKLIRAQGALITDQEIQSVVDFIARQGKPSYEMEIHQQLSKPSVSFEDANGIDEDEEIIQQCIEVIRSEQKASVSLLQRRLRLGYGRAARIMDELENRGIVGPSNGAEPRDILIDLDGTGADGNPAVPK